jgi:hypothetical protein
MPVGGFDQVGLRASPHLPDKPARIDGHQWSNLVK